MCYNTYVPTGRTAKAVDFMQKILTPLPSPNQTKSKTKLEKNARRAWRLLTTFSRWSLGDPYLTKQLVREPCSYPSSFVDSVWPLNQPLPPSCRSTLRLPCRLMSPPSVSELASPLSRVFCRHHFRKHLVQPNLPSGLNPLPPPPQRPPPPPPP